MDKCKRCTGMLGVEADGIYCLNCGWRDGRKSSRMFTIKNYGSKQEWHYDPTDFIDRRVIASFLKKCPGSNKVAHLMGTRVRCNYCHKLTTENKNGKASPHVPSVTFADRVKEVIAEYMPREEVK